MRFPAILLLALLMLPGCGNLRNLAAKSQAKKERKQLDKLIAASAGEASARLGEKAVGEIASVSEHYVLLRLLTGVVMPTGTELESRRNGTRTALLTMTPEKKSLFTIADLTEGAPQTGDSLYLSKARPSLPSARPGAVLGNPVSAPPGSAPEPVDSLPLLPPPATGGTDDFNPKDLPSLPGRILNPDDVIQKR
ncbi:MAG: hypothetical protein V4726_19760 [Verrucomicrobiota bacterium]